jgi:FkbM family methyltransferase
VAGEEDMAVLTPIEPYIVRKDSCGVRYCFIVADQVSQLWWDTPRSEPISEDAAHRYELQLDRGVAIGWHEMAILRDQIALPGSRILECGCHHGLTTIFLAAWTGHKGMVVAFDAVLLNSLVAKKNLELNRIENAAVYCAAVGDRFGTVDLHNESNVIVMRSDQFHHESNIMVRMDNLLDWQPDVLKLDIEGAELAFVESHQEFVAAIPRLAIEVHTNLLAESGASRLIDHLGDRPLYLLREDGRYGPYRGEPITERVHLFSY